ncbi:hypothetical protein BDR04DRAFT_252373 [Suillus decipiens]|nr:hypothetical protein BDR04DRAFT_252373 [Suillus decipiens]
MEQLLPFHDWQALLLCTSYGKGECKGRNQKNLGELLHVVSPSPTRVGRSTDCNLNHLGNGIQANDRTRMFKKPKSQNDSVTQLLSVTIHAINTAKDIVPIALAQGILGTIANILTMVGDQEQVQFPSDSGQVQDHEGHP